MKKTLAAIMALLALFALVGCTPAAGDPTLPPTETSSLMNSDDKAIEVCLGKLKDETFPALNVDIKTTTIDEVVVNIIQGEKPEYVLEFLYTVEGGEQQQYAYHTIEIDGVVNILAQGEKVDIPENVVDMDQPIG